VVFARKTLMVAHRVLRELLRDHRSRIVLMVTPALLVILVRQLFNSAEAFAPSAALMLGIFPAFSMCLFGSTALVRERTEGTLEKILTTPITKTNLVCGYACAAVVASLVQAAVTVTAAFAVVRIHTASPVWLMGLLTALCGVFGMSLGLCISAASKNEGEAFQFLPGVMIPQMLVSGVVFPVAHMGAWVQRLESLLPLSAVTNTMADARTTAYGGTPMAVSLAAMLGIIAAALALAVLTVAKRSATL
jgi:ABC-2 type transport system permease protein